MRNLQDLYTMQLLLIGQLVINETEVPKELLNLYPTEELIEKYTQLLDEESWYTILDIAKIPEK